MISTQPNCHKTRELLWFLEHSSPKLHSQVMQFVETHRVEMGHLKLIRRITTLECVDTLSGMRCRTKQLDPFEFVACW